MSLAVEWTATACESGDIVVICTDSQSLCRALSGSHPNPPIDELRPLFAECKAKLVVQWILGSEIPGNDLTDLAAKEACTLDEGPGLITYGSACALVNSTIKDDPPTHERTKAVYIAHSSKLDRELPTRSDQVLLTRIRSGHHLAFRAYKHRLDDEIDPTCPRCDAPQHTLEHWLQDCQGVFAAKSELLEETEPGLEVLGTKPIRSTALARRTLLCAGLLRA